MLQNQNNWKQIKQNKPQYNLDRQTVKTSAISSGNVCKYEFLTRKDALSEKELFQKILVSK